MKAQSALIVCALVLVPSLLWGQTAPSDSCKTVSLKAPVLWRGVALAEVDIRTGPGDNYPVHESGQLLEGEEVQVLQDCHGWLEARVIPVRLIDTAIEQNGRKRAREMLPFWVRKGSIRRRR